jgi:hypothetical protein
VDGKAVYKIQGLGKAFEAKLKTGFGRWGPG